MRLWGYINNCKYYKSCPKLLVFTCTFSQKHYLLCTVQISPFYHQSIIALSWKYLPSVLYRIVYLQLVFVSLITIYILQVLLLSSFYHTASPPDGQTPYPGWAKVVGWLVSALPAAFLPLGAVLRFLQYFRKQNVIEVFAILCSSSQYCVNFTLSIQSSVCNSDLAKCILI